MWQDMRDEPSAPHTRIRALVGRRAVETPRKGVSSPTLDPAAYPETWTESCICLDLSFPEDETKNITILTYHDPNIWVSN